LTAVPPTEPEIGMQSGPGWACVRVSGELDLSSVAPVAEALLAAIAPEGRIEADLRAVTFIDSSGMAVLERCRRRAVALGAELVVSCVEGGAVARLLELTGMGRVLNVRTEAP